MRKNVIIAILAVIVLVLSITNYQSAKMTKEYQEMAEDVVASVDPEGKIVIIGFLTGQYFGTLISANHAGIVSDEDFAEVEKMIEDFVKDPTYEKAKIIFERETELVIGEFKKEFKNQPNNYF